jgi:hypothetical protein
VNIGIIGFNSSISPLGSNVTRKLRTAGGILAFDLWLHPYGGHLFSVFPWAHLLFSEKVLIRWRNGIRDDGARCFREVAGGLNQMTIGKFFKMVNSSSFREEQIETIPIRRLSRLHNRLTREFTTPIVRCRLRKIGERNGFPA